MAFTIPAEDPGGLSEAAAAERKVLIALRKRLPDGSLVYRNATSQDHAPSFTVIGPDLGVIALEVKDWRPDASGARAMENAGESLRSSVQKIRAALRAGTGGAEAPEWTNRVGQAIVLPAFSRTDLVMPSAGAASLTPDKVLCGDDLEAPELPERLRRLIAGPAGAPRLSAEQIDAIRGALYPELRVSWGATASVLDLEQDRIAHLPESGRYLVEGPAGSGKTLTLIARVRHLRQRRPQWRILVLCFSRVVADHLREALGPDPRLDVLHFHSWCWRMLDRAGLEIPSPETPAEREAYWRHTIPQLMLEAFKAQRLVAGRAEAILVDDGHDFHDSWYDVILQALDPAANSLLIMSDPRQVTPAQCPRWPQLGITGASRQLRLGINYRVRHQILSAAEALTGGASTDLSSPDSSANSSGAPQPKGGFAPDVRRFATAAAEHKRVLVWLRQRLSGGIPPERILILGLLKPEMAELEVWLEDLGIPSRLIAGRSVPGVVRVSTIHGAKGLEADFVVLLHAHQLEQLRPSEARHLLYTVLTRARVQLSVYSHGESPLLDELDAILNPRTIVPWAPKPQRPRQSNDPVSGTR